MESANELLERAKKNPVLRNHYINCAILRYGNLCVRRYLAVNDFKKSVQVEMDKERINILQEFEQLQKEQADQKAGEGN